MLLGLTGRPRTLESGGERQKALTAPARLAVAWEQPLNAGDL